MARKAAIQFTVVNPSSGLHSGVFRIWCSKNDVYIAPRDHGGTYKVSLHPGEYRIAFTREHWLTGEAPNVAPGPGRIIRTYPPPSEVVDGVEYCWRLMFQADALLESSAREVEVIELLPETPTEVTQVNVWICAPWVTAQPRRPLGEPLHLSDGRMLKVGYDTFRAPLEKGYAPGRRDYVGSMLEFIDRRQPQDAPGLALRPVELG